MAVQYSNNGSATQQLLNGASASVPAGTLITLTPQTTPNILSVNYFFSAPGSTIDGTSITTNAAPWVGDVWLPTAPTTAVLTTTITISPTGTSIVTSNTFFIITTVNSGGSGVAALTTSGIGTLSAAGSSAIAFYSATDFSGGTSHTRNDNQTPIQAAINAAIADPGRRQVLIPRDTTGPYPGNNFLNITAPIEITDASQLIFGGENEWVTIRANGFYGPCLIAGPSITAPTPVQDGTSGFWGLNLSGGAWLPLDLAGTTVLDGATACTWEFWLNATLGTANGVFISSDGQRGLSEPVTSAIKLGITNLNKVTVAITTSITGVSNYTSTAALPNGVRTKVEVAFDQATTAVRIYIGGVYDGQITLAASETISVGHEDYVLNGGGGCSWKYLAGRGTATVVNGLILYSFRQSNIARHTTNSNYTPETSELTQDSHTQLVLNFDPVFNGTCATSKAGFCSGAFALINAQGISGPVYLPWQTNNAAQMAQLQIQNITFQCVGCAGPWLWGCPNTRLVRVGLLGNGPVGWTMFGNCYNSEVHGFDAAWGNTVGSFTGQKWGTFYYLAGGSNSFQDIQIAGGTYGMLLMAFSGHIFGNSYILPQGRGGAVIKGTGADYCVTWDNCFIGDETKLMTDFGIMLIGSSGNSTYTFGSSSVNVTQGNATIVGVGTTWTHANGPTAGMIVAFVSQPGVNYTIQSITDDTHIVLTTPYTGTTTTPTTIQLTHAGGGGLHAIFNGGVPQLTTSTAPIFLIDGGTCHKINCETWQAIGNAGAVVCKFLRDTDDGTFLLGTQNTIFSNGTYVPWMPENTSSANQGTLFVESLRQGKLLKYPCPDSTYNIPISIALSSTLAPVGVLTATRTHLLPLRAGYEWRINNTFQTGTPQSVTYQCTSNGATGTGGSVTIAAGKHAIVACYDTAIGLERVTQDT